jgi:hypothetical protein
MFVQTSVLVTDDRKDTSFNKNFPFSVNYKSLKFFKEQALGARLESNH